MEETKHCEEFTGLFIVRNCENVAVKNCAKCNKNICNTHAFNAENIFTHVDSYKTYKENKSIVCISCFTELDARLTDKIELYSKDRAIWRRKMIERFHEEYQYMLFMANDYGSLFDTNNNTFFHEDTDDGSYFDS